VSQAIAKLEQELGEVLFERSSRDGTLTNAGAVLREYAAKLLNLRAEASGALTELRELHRGRLNLAANEYTCLYLLPLLDEFRRQNRRIKLAVQRAPASRISDEKTASIPASARPVGGKSPPHCLRPTGPRPVQQRA
jgi:DNA-binding transcriptional LysR family regulator